MKRKMFCGAVVLLAMCSVFAAEGDGDIGGSEETTGTPPVLGEISASFAERTASYLTGTLSIPVTSLGGGEGTATLQVELARDADFSDVFTTFTRSVTAAKTETFDLMGITPSSTTYVRVIATAADGASLTDATYSFTASAGWKNMCYKPPEKKQDYPWTWDDYWYSSPNSATGLKYLPSLGDDVRLYSSKNVTVPLRVGNGVHAETCDLTIGTNNGHYQWFLVEAGGTMTNAGNVVVGSDGANADSAGHIHVWGEWNTLRDFALGNSTNGSTLVIEEGGRFICTNSVSEEGSRDINLLLVGGNDATSVDNVITNKGEMSVWDFHIGSGTKSIPSGGVVENYGTLNIGRKLTIGRKSHSYGRLHLHPDSVLRKRHVDWKPIILGSEPDSEGILETETDVELANSGDYIQIARAARARGTLLLASNATFRLFGNIQMGFGESSHALVELTENSTLEFNKDSRPVMGDKNVPTNSTCRIVLRDSARLTDVSRLDIPSAACVTGLVEVLDRAVITNLRDQAITLGTYDHSAGRLVVGTNAFIGPLKELNLSLESQFSTSEIEMQGGTIALEAAPGGTWRLFLGNADQTETRARIRGWGRFIRTGKQNNMLRMKPYGQLIADGQGEERDLDFHEFRTVGAGQDVNHNTTGSNGWYAVSKGRIIYPRIQNINAGTHRVIGDYPNRSMPLLVNSLCFTMTAYPEESDYHAYAELYASDRTDIPRGLPKPKKALVKGVWRLGFSSGSGVPAEPTPVGFTGLKLQIRHDTQDLGEDDRLTVYHHDGSATGSWRAVMKTKVFNPEDPYVVTETPVNPSSETWNAGWFALVARPREKGVTIILR